MPLNWEAVAAEQHEQLPREQKQAQKDPEWEAVLGELMSGRAVVLRYADEKERGTLSRSIGRRTGASAIRM